VISQPAYKKQALPVLTPNPLQAFNMEQHFTPLRLPINEVFNIILDQLWVKCLKPIQYDPTVLRVEEYYSYYDSKRHQTIQCRSLRKYLEELVC